MLTQQSTREHSSRGLRRGKSATTKTTRRRFDFLPYALVAPLAIFIVALALIPAFYTIVASFFRDQQLNPHVKFNGLSNFVNLFQDAAVVSSIWNTAMYVAFGVLISTLLAIGMAVVLRQKFRGRSILIAVLILPWALPGVVNGIIWSSIWDSNSGLLNSVLTSLHLIDSYQVFLGQNKFETILAIALVQIWQITPLSTLLVLAAMQNIPAELYEAASLDGGSPRQVFWRITLPLSAPGITIAMVQAIIATLNIFDQPYVLNGAAPTAASLTMQTYFISFQNLDFGQGYALSLLITIATLVLSLGVMKFVYRRVEF